jgi:hypothetical protein
MKTKVLGIAATLVALFATAAAAATTITGGGCCPLCK